MLAAVGGVLTALGFYLFGLTATASFARSNVSLWLSGTVEPELAGDLRRGLFFLGVLLLIESCILAAGLLLLLRSRAIRRAGSHGSVMSQ